MKSNHKNYNKNRTSYLGSVNYFIKLIQIHLELLSRNIAKYRYIIVENALRIKSKTELEIKIVRNKAAEMLIKKLAYTFRASFEKSNFITKNTIT
ncbi:MAG: hypothetical protein ACD_30C00092G0006 [uncultured bacterium]|uniref:Uncharacterized protein n=2 Tax=Candidatus Daviesiibacteriota TaxID=1752718 RepID=A0A0G0I1M8_9BACT|nr:MAG: hypothetical protein ACD_30C00092G0006 [uncultured bacterium]KKQ10021.1 MAG: hypothetical protein US19_C0009G0023 [Candidatus Daviesbacteria bacterium GW2011_GWB1_36_5]OGE35227.1 MAG: hypothetical protein A3E66_00020 [Candidatus Daviesbacteria bacterium RIFCSPHIGHO2_12_FULL_37_16]